MTSNYTKMKRAIGRAHKASMNYYETNGSYDGITITAYGVKIMYSLFLGKHEINGKIVSGLDLEKEFLDALPYLQICMEDETGETWAKVLYETEAYWHCCYEGDENLDCCDYHWSIEKRDGVKTRMSNEFKKGDDSLHAIIGNEFDIRT